MKLEVCIPDLMETGIAEELSAGGFEVTLDCAKTVEIVDNGRVRKISWKEYRVKSGFLWKFHSWKWHFGDQRRLRVQAHPIRHDGSWGRRVIVREMINGRIII